MEEFRYESANRADEARSDVRVMGFWGNRRYAFFDFRVFYPFATTYLPMSLSSAYRSCSRAKKREYQERVERVEDVFHPYGDDVYWRYGSGDVRSGEVFGC